MHFRSPQMAQRSDAPDEMPGGLTPPPIQLFASKPHDGSRTVQHTPLDTVCLPVSRATNRLHGPLRGGMGRRLRDAGNSTC